jgi:chromosome segregation ATPase
MPLFNRRCSLLEVQNRALIKTARERAARMDELERELAQATNEVERLTLERDFYSKRASALEEENRELTESATKYSVHAQNVANSTGLIRMVRPVADSEPKAKSRPSSQRKWMVF